MSSVINYPNQRGITINKPKQYPNGIYTMIGKDELQEAILLLTPSELKLWLYFMENSPLFEVNYSKKAFMNWSDLKEKSARDAFNGLIAKGYIIMTTATIGNFYSTPQTPKPLQDMGF